MRIAVAADHTGIELKARLLLWLGERGSGTKVLGDDQALALAQPWLETRLGAGSTPRA